MTTEAGSSRAPQTDDPYDQIFDVRRHLADLLAHWRVVVAGAVLGTAAGAVTGLLWPVSYEATVRLRIANRADVVVTPTIQSTYRGYVADPIVAEYVVAQLGLAAPPIGLDAARFGKEALSSRIVDQANIIRVSVRLRDPLLAEKAAILAGQRAVELWATQTATMAAPNDAEIERAKGSTRKLVIDTRKELVDFLATQRPETVGRQAYEVRLKQLHASVARAEMLQGRIDEIDVQAARDRLQTPHRLQYVEGPVDGPRQVSPTVLMMAARGMVSGMVGAMVLLIGYWILSANHLRQRP
jgi:hypothetical protein